MLAIVTLPTHGRSSHLPVFSFSNTFHWSLMTEVLQSSPYLQIHCQRKILDIFIFCRSEFGRDEHSALSPLPATTERDHHLVQYARYKPIAFQAICFQPRCWEKVQTDQSEQCPSVYVYDQAHHAIVDPVAA